MEQQNHFSLGATQKGIFEMKIENCTYYPVYEIFDLKED